MGVDETICLVCGGSTFVGETISCETCLHWYHFNCVGVTHSDDCVVKEDVPYFCPSCNEQERRAKKAKKATTAAVAAAANESGCFFCCSWKISTAFNLLLVPATAKSGHHWKQIKDEQKKS